MENLLVINENQSLNSLMSDEIVMQWLLDLEADSSAELPSLPPLMVAVG